MKYLLQHRNPERLTFIRNNSITLKYLNPFSEAGFRELLCNKLNGKVFPNIELSLRVKTDEEHVITSAKILWRFEEDEILYRSENDVIFFYNRDRAQGRIDSLIDEAIDEFFNSLECNDLLAKLLTDIPILKHSIDKVD